MYASTAIPSGEEARADLQGSGPDPAPEPKSVGGGTA